jgi:hypothetical protein
VAGPLDNPGLSVRAARVLAASAGGPSHGEARRRLTQGLPLIVGISRAQAEDLQGRLVALGLVPRLGPAPDGTDPLLPPRHASPSRGVWLGLVGGIVLLSVLLAFRAARAPQRAAPPLAARSTPVRLAAVVPRVRARQQPAARGPAAETVPADQVELWARVQIVKDGFRVEGWARIRTPDAPAGPLVLLGEVAGAEVLNASLAEAQARRGRARAEPDGAVTWTMPFRVGLSRDRLGSAGELVLEATWDGWRSELLTLEIPAG